MVQLREFQFFLPPSRGLGPQPGHLLLSGGLLRRCRESLLAQAFLLPRFGGPQAKELQLESLVPLSHRQRPQLQPQAFSLARLSSSHSLSFSVSLLSFPLPTCLNLRSLLLPRQSSPPLLLVPSFRVRQLFRQRSR